MVDLDHGFELTGLGEPEQWEGLDEWGDDLADLDVHLGLSRGSGGLDGFMDVADCKWWDDLAVLDVCLEFTGCFKELDDLVGLGEP